jgi:hypothetical protein
MGSMNFPFPIKMDLLEAASTLIQKTHLGFDGPRKQTYVYGGPGFPIHLGLFAIPSPSVAFSCSTTKANHP